MVSVKVSDRVHVWVDRLRREKVTEPITVPPAPLYGLFVNMIQRIPNIPRHWGQVSPPGRRESERRGKALPCPSKQYRNPPRRSLSILRYHIPSKRRAHVHQQ